MSYSEITALGRVGGRGEVYLSTYDLPAGKQLTQDLTH